MAQNKSIYAMTDIANQEDYKKAQALSLLIQEIEKGRKSGEEEGWLSEKEIKEYFKEELNG